jgi:hypothetical protein
MNDPEQRDCGVSLACVEALDQRLRRDRLVGLSGTLQAGLSRRIRISEADAAFIPDIRASLLEDSKIKEIGEKVREFPSIIKAFQN